jgi:hypothetical protein
MPDEASDELPNVADFPEMIDDLKRAGSTARQIALRETAWTMLERWSFEDGFSTGRIANAWLGEHDWRVQIIWQRDLWLPEKVAGLTAAATRRGHRILFGCAIGAGIADGSAVWRIPVTDVATSRFFASHYASFSLVFPEDLSFAVHCWEGDLALVAGPEKFLREALPPEEVGHEAMSAAIEASDPRATADDYAVALAPYRPFMLA